MIHPSYLELMHKINEDSESIGEVPVVNSRYSIVCATAKRARQLIDGDEPLIDYPAGEKKKPLSVAVDEMDQGLLKIQTPEEQEETEERIREAEKEPVVLPEDSGADDGDSSEVID